MPTDLSGEELRAITQALDEVRDAYAEDSRVIFATESERAKLHFGSIRRRLKGWAKSRKCMVPHCQIASISRSHAVPKGMSLSHIAEDGHLLSPAFNYHEGTVELENIGVSDATTFPGFCLQHEQLFADFERAKSLVTESQGYLQMYRAACRESFRTNFLIEQHDWAINEYCKARDEGLLRIVRERVKSAAPANDLLINSFSMKGDPVVLSADELIAPVRRFAAHFDTAMLPALEAFVFHAKTSGMAVDLVSLDWEIPVALSGASTFYVEDKGKSKQVNLLVNVLPCVGSTLIILGALGSMRKYVDAYMTQWFKHGLTILSMIESWMTNGTDQWYLKPAIWKAIPHARQRRILSLVLSDEKNIADECDVSIFDAVRERTIVASDVANAGKFTPAYLSFIASERRKLT